MLLINISIEKFVLALRNAPLEIREWCEVNNIPFLGYDPNAYF
ncbi:hypothetical protein [Chitinophaga fulva]|nr:hypothetical protein [Chitinophaga fulva]